MRFFLPLTLLTTLVACTSRPTGDATSDLGTPHDAGTGDANAVDGSATDGGGSDGGNTDGGGVDGGSTSDAGGTDASTRDGGLDLGGEACGTSVCGAGSYCCAAACNLCLPDSMFCLSDPCAGVDAGPPHTDGGTAHDAGVDAGTCLGIGCRAPSTARSAARPTSACHPVSRASRHRSRDTTWHNARRRFFGMNETARGVH